MAQSSGNKVGRVLIKFITYLVHKSNHPILGIYPKEMETHVHTKISM